MAFQTPDESTSLTRDQQIRRAALEAALMADCGDEEEDESHDAVACLLSISAKLEGYIRYGTD